MNNSTVNSFFEIPSFRNTSLYQFLASTGENLSFYKDKAVEASNNHQTYKIIPLTIGGWFGYTAIKDLFFGVVGYDGMLKSSGIKDFLKYRFNLISEAYNDSSKPFNEKLSLVSQAFFGSMKGKQRATLLAKFVLKASVAYALIKPNFNINSKPEMDIEAKKSFFGLREHTIEAATTQRTSISDIEAAQYMYQTQKATMDQEILNPKMDLKMQEFAERVVNPKDTSITGSLKEASSSLCDKTLGWTKYTDYCKTFDQNKHVPIYTKGPFGTTKTNIERLNKQCAKLINSIPDSKPPLGTRVADLFKTGCNYTLGWTNWGTNKCASLRASEGLGPTNEQRVQGLSIFANDFCNQLKRRAIFEGDFATLYNTSATQQEQASALRNLGEAPIASLKSMTGNAEYVLGSIANQDPEHFKKLTHQFFNISETETLTKKNIAKAFREISQHSHADKTLSCNKTQQDAKETLFAGAKTLKEVLKSSPNLYEGRNYYSLSEAKDSILRFLQAPVQRA